MGLGIDVGVYANRKVGRLAEMRGAGAKKLQFARAFDVEQQDAGAESEVDFVGQLADSGEDDFGGRLAVGLQHAVQFAAGDDVEAGAERGEQF